MSATPIVQVDLGPGRQISTPASLNHVRGPGPPSVFPRGAAVVGQGLDCDGGGGEFDPLPPELSLKICRAESVVVRGHDREGKPVEVRGESLLARALQHEVDHLDGILLLDRVNPVRREIVKKKLKKALAASE